MGNLHRVQVRRVYDDPAPADGTRVLAETRTLTLLTASKAVDISEAAVLAGLLQ
jgi:uncharacterized protein YeaO (DUF488 family)